MVEGGMPAEVTRLVPRERVSLDPSRLESLHAQLGVDEVRAMVDRAMDELCLLRDDLSVQYRGRNLPDFQRSLRRLGRICDHLGLSMISRVAADVGRCLDRGDATATAATWARLRRSLDAAASGRWTLLA
jgi:hypothetical protein